MNEKIKGIYIFRPCLTLNTFKMRRKKNTPKSTMYLKTFKKKYPEKITDKKTNYKHNFPLHFDHVSDT